MKLHVFTHTCPHCRKQHETSADLMNQAEVKEGNILMCDGCGKTSILTRDLELRMLTPSEIRMFERAIEKLRR